MTDVYLVQNVNWVSGMGSERGFDQVDGLIPVFRDRRRAEAWRDLYAAGALITEWHFGDRTKERTSND